MTEHMNDAIHAVNAMADEAARKADGNAEGILARIRHHLAEIPAYLHSFEEPEPAPAPAAEPVSTPVEEAPAPVEPAAVEEAAPTVEEAAPVAEAVEADEEPPAVVAKEDDGA